MAKFYTPFCLISVLFFSSCFNSRQLGYFQDLSDTSRVHKLSLLPEDPLRLQPDDEIQINISSISPEATQFFNLLQPAPNAGIGSGQGQMFQNIYTVNQQGQISLPVLGDIKVLNLTTEALRLRIKQLLKDYLKEPVVTVRLVNFRVTVIGEVGHPNVVPVKGERINVIEALGATGDLTIFAKRYNVKVVRRNGDSLDVAHLNLNDSRSIRSPFFHLKQNDLIYVEPNKSRGIISESWTMITPVITSILTLLVIIVSNILR
jgi:polysaccharide export outer membrane protein